MKLMLSLIKRFQVHPYNKPYYPRQNHRHLFRIQDCQYIMVETNQFFLEAIPNVLYEHMHHHQDGETIRNQFHDDH